jgi:hypothetical protein
VCRRVRVRVGPIRSVGPVTAIKFICEGNQKKNLDIISKQSCLPPPGCSSLAMAPPRIPGAGGRGAAGRGKGGGGYKRGMGKNFGKNKDGSGKPTPRKTGFGMWAVGGLFLVMVGFVSFAAKREKDTREAGDTSLRARLRRKSVEFSEHASCRMDCRFVSRAEVLETLLIGTESKRHSTPSARPCPRWALENGRTRAVWAECADKTKLVTVIDTVTNHPCGPC